MKIKRLIIMLALLPMAVSAQQASADWAKLAQEAKEKRSKQSRDLPGKDLMKKVSAISLPDKEGIKKLAIGLRSGLKTTVDPVSLASVAEFLNQEKNDSLAANTGMMLYLAGKNADCSVIMLCHGIEKTGDAWAVNNLGVILKNRADYEKALRCFLYANKQLAPSAVVKTNLGWTAAYYGDFDAAKMYFNEALVLEPEHEGALEGLSVLAYVEGDSQALLEYLFKRLKFSGGGSSNFIAPGLVDLVEEEYRKNPELRKADPFENHMFDNSNEEDNQTTPGGASNIIPELPTLTAYFSYDPFHLNESMDEIRQLKKRLLIERDQRINQLSIEQASLPPWKKEPYKDEHGDLVIPYNYEPAYKLFERVTIEFNKRDIWLASRSIREEMDFNKTIMAGDQLVKMLNACTGKEGCTCQWAKANLGVVNSDLAGYFIFWSKLYKQWLDNVNWYIAASSAFIKKVHQPQLNAFLNHKREAVVRAYLMSKYATWLDDCLKVGGEIDMLNITKECSDNPPKTSIAAVDASNPPLKKLKAWPEKCNVPTGDYDGGIAALHMTCDELRVSFGKGMKLNWETKFGANENQDLTKIYISGGIEKGKTTSVNMDGHEVGELGVSGELKAKLFIQFQNGNVVDYGLEGNASLTGTAGVKSGIDKIDKYLPNGAITARADFIISAETGMKGNAAPVEMTAGGLLQNLK
jgi:tetratricopeptide (TPR) repeat protein